MADIIDFFSKLFMAESWPARWYCGVWTGFHGWLYIGSNIAIWAAYFAIPFVLLYFILKRNDIPFVRVFWLFILFILACGVTHLVDAILFYYPAYRFSALVLFVCAVISWVTVVALVKILPDALSLKSISQLETIISSRTKNLRLVSADLKRQNGQLLNYAHITSHDLREPISNIISLIELHDMEEDQKEKEKYYNMFRSESNNMLSTLNELNESLKIQNSDEVERTIILFDDVLEEVKNSISTLIDQTKAKIETDFSALEQINYPRIYLSSILRNLITNAIKYKHPDRQPHIRISTSLVDGVEILECRDNGSGLDLRKYGSKIFRLHKRFHGNEDSRGVGLFITKNQVEAMGGTIEIESDLGVGAKFTVRFNSINNNKI